MPDISHLNKEQKQAVTYGQGPVLIVAGAGTGKTTVLTSRIAYLIEKNKAKPEEILAVTFTEKAAQEMEERVGDLISIGYIDLWISTFHSFCERVLRDYGLDIGLNTDFKIVDEIGSWSLIRENFDRLKLDYYKPQGNPTKFIKALVSHFSRCKDQEVLPEDYLRFAKTAKEEKEKIKEVSQSYFTYQKLLLEKNLLDFGDLINYCLKLFKERPLVLEKYRKQFKFILVDEFQDTNWAQYKLIKLLAAPKNNLTMAADDDQSIYKFRGASFGNVVQFKKDFPKAKLITLKRNYRSCQNLLDLAYKFIQANNPNRLEYIAKIEKNLLAEKKGKAQVLLLRFKSLEEEAEGVVSKIIEILKKDRKAQLSDFAILVRANDYAQPFARALERAEIPYQFLALKGLYLKPIILDIISYFKLLDNYHENSAMFRILSLPFLEISAEDIAKITQYSYRFSKSIYESLKEIILIPGISKNTIKSSNHILSLIRKHSQTLRSKKVSEIMIAFLDDSGYLEYLAKEEKREEINYLSQFHSKIKKFEEETLDPNLKNFIQTLNLELEAGELGKLTFDIEQGPQTVKIMTLHSAKGLEFKYVFLVNLVDKRFPAIERKELIEIPEPLIKDKIPKGDRHLEEERRLFYVGMTRAKQGLFFTSAKDYGGQREKKLSQFLFELGYKEENLPPPKYSYALVPGSTFEERAKTDRTILPDHFSFTQLIAFSTCPLQYKFSHILRIPVKGRPTFSFGKTMHKTLFDFVSQSIKGKTSFRELIDIYNRNWIDEWYENKKQRDEYYLLGKKSLERFYKNFKEKKPEIYLIKGKPALEQSFNFKIGGYKIIGKIDRIDILNNTKTSPLAAARGLVLAGLLAEIIDYKTGKSKEKLSAEDKMQLIIYQLAAKEVFGLEPVKLTYYYLDSGKTVSFLAKESDLEKEKEKIVSKIEQIKKSDFKARPGRHCQWCDFNTICEFAQKS